MLNPYIYEQSLFVSLLYSLYHLYNLNLFIRKSTPILALINNIGKIHTKYLERVSQIIKNENTPNIQILNKYPNLLLLLNNDILPKNIKISIVEKLI